MSKNWTNFKFLISKKELLILLEIKVSFQIDDDSSENIEAASRYPDNFQRVEEPGDQFFSHSYESPDHDDGVYLNDQEIVKIKCFYSSMGCYVHVSRSIAELYQLKRDDAFEELDNDPVNDYRLYMEKLESKKTEEQLEEDTAEKVAKQRNANYMYINSGVPVIIFNYGANPKRVKDLRVLLVERSTGFCMWQFKYNWLTHFKNSNNITVARVAYAHNTVNKVEESSSTQAANNPTSVRTFKKADSFFNLILNRSFLICCFQVNRARSAVHIIL